MATEDLRLSEVLPAAPERVFDAWLSSKEHSAFTRSKAVIDPVTFGRHSASDGYIEGITLEIDRPRRIVQTWRTTEFPRSSPDSRLEILFDAADGGTRLTVVHTDIPPGQADRYSEGWRQYYFDPMLAYFGKSKAAPQKKAAAKKKAAARKSRVRAKVKKKSSETRRKAKPLGKRKVAKKK